MSSNTKTRKTISNEAISIPKDIQKTISEKGYYLYEWIGNEDVKESIERDFLELLSKYGFIGALILIIPTVIGFILGIPFTYTLFAILLVGINIYFLGYILLTSLVRSKILRKNNQVLITDTSISINGVINKIQDNKILVTSDIEEIAFLFEEMLFHLSGIHLSKRKFKAAVFEKTKDGYSSILNKMRSSGKNGGQIIILLIGLYTLYVVSLGFIYFIGIVVIWFLGLIVSFINKKILIATGHEITKINNSFENIDEYSKKLEGEREILIQLLQEAKNNDWKDSLLIKINSGLVLINNQADKAIKESIYLKKIIQNSKYSEMFNFAIYNSWIKREILVPLEQINILLIQNLNSLELQIGDIDAQLLTQMDKEKHGALSVSKTRSIMRGEEIKKHIENMEVYIAKLKK